MKKKLTILQSFRSASKAQVLIITLFILGISMITTYMLLMPVISQAQRSRYLLNSFQALANATTGIEIGNYYALKGINIYDINSSTPHCDEFVSGYSRCEGANISAEYFQAYIDFAVRDDPVLEIIGTRTISQGIHRNTSRILQFIFIPR